MEVKFSTNDKVTIYPNKRGFEKMVLLIEKNYCIAHSEAIEKVANKQTENYGYTDQLWCIISDFNEMFFNGQNYFENTYMKIEK